MDKLKEIKKGGWHPADNGAKGTFGIRDKVNSTLGRGASAGSSFQREPTPISSLRDPSTFAPPPKRIDSAIQPPPGRPGFQQPQQQPQQQPLGLTQYGHQEEYAEEPAPPPRPYRVDTTGLSTANLPPPPRRTDGASSPSPSYGTARTSPALPPPPAYTRSTVGAAAAAAKPPPPSLPPRLPPRQNSASPTTPSPNANASAGGGQGGFLNQGALSRLGAAGVSVPGLGISGSGHGNSRPPLPPPTMGRSSPNPPSPAAGSGVSSELQSRFGKLGLGRGGGQQGSTPPAAAAPAQGTTWAEKQAALRTMSDFKKNPGSVSFSDASTAASTANNFRQRHGDQVVAGMKTANGLDQKYGVSGKVGGYMSGGGESSGSGAAAGGVGGGNPASHLSTIGAAASGVLGKKKPPPPPPPKRKPDLGGRADGAPPPVPMATRPNF